jgi:hypothetical protein
MAESETWFAARKLAPKGLSGHGFSFVATDPDNPTSYSNEDAVMTIKLAEAWALNPEAPLTRAFEILSYVFKHTPPAKLISAIKDMIGAVRQSPSKEVRNREKDLSDYLRLKGLLL